MKKQNSRMYLLSDCSLDDIHRKKSAVIVVEICSGVTFRQNVESVFFRRVLNS